MTHKKLQTCLSSQIRIEKKSKFSYCSGYTKNLMYDYTVENVINACEQSQIQGPLQQSANDFLTEWQLNETSIFTALEIIQTTGSLIARYYSAVLLSRRISDYWGKIEQKETKINFRETLIKYAMSLDTNDKILDFLLKAVTDIAIYDWPQDWESFGSYFFTDEDSSDMQKLNSLKLLAEYVENLNTTKNVTNQRKQNLKNFFVENLINLRDKVLKSFSYGGQFPSISLNVYKILLLWFPLSDVLTPEIIEKIIQFLQNEEIVTPVLQCLTSIFILRADSDASFNEYGTLLINTLATGTFANKHPITSNLDVVNFLIRILHIYIPFLELVFSNDKVSEYEDFPIKDLYDETIFQFINKTPSIGQMKEEVNHLFRVVLSMDSQTIEEPFWQLWLDILRRIFFETVHKIKDGPSTYFFRPMFDDIRRILINNISSAVMEDGQILHPAKVSITMLFKIEEDETTKYLCSQPPSTQLCYIVGCLEYAVEQKPNHSLIQLVVELVEHSKIYKEPDYIIGLLYALSHAQRFFSDLPDLFNQYNDLISSCFQEGTPEITAAAVDSIFTLMQRNSTIFRGEDTQFIEQLIMNSESYLNNLQKDYSLKMFRICCFFICSTESIEDITGSFKTLFEPLISNLESMNDQNLVEKSLEIIYDCSYNTIIHVTSNEIFNLIMPTLLKMAEILIPNQSVSNDFLLILLKTIAAVQVSNDYEKSIDITNKIYQLMLSRGSIEESFTVYFSVLCHYFDQINNFYEDINTNIITPLLQMEDPPYSSIFLLLQEFSPKQINLQWFTDLSIRTISDFRTNVVETCVNATMRIFSELDINILFDLMRNVSLQYIDVLLRGITDTMHQQVFYKYIDFLHFILRFITTADDYNFETFKNVIVNILKGIQNEPEENFYDQFASYILNIVDSVYDFKNAFVNFLIAIKKISPGDKDLFKNYDFSRYDNIFNQLFSQILNPKVIMLPNQPSLSILFCPNSINNAPNNITKDNIK